MPKQVLPTPEHFAFIEIRLKKWGFRRITRGEVGVEIKRRKLRAPRPQKGREVGFLFSANGLTVVVWTTWLVGENRARESDAGWVIILDKDGNRVYVATPTHRTKNFRFTLLKRAWIARWRALHRPYCPRCGEWMKVTSGRAVKSRYWSCANRSAHPDDEPFISLDWDDGADITFEHTPKAKKWLAKKRKEKQKYRKQRKKEGKAHQRALFRRNTWESQG